MSIGWFVFNVVEECGKFVVVVLVLMFEWMMVVLGVLYMNVEK